MHQGGWIALSKANSETKLFAEYFRACSISHIDYYRLLETWYYKKYNET